jgi:hypothetical protein
LLARFVFAKAWGHVFARPDGLLRMVGRTSLNEVYALVRFNILSREMIRAQSKIIVLVNVPGVIVTQGDSFPANNHEVIRIDVSLGIVLGGARVAGMLGGAHVAGILGGVHVAGILSSLHVASVIGSLHIASVLGGVLVVRILRDFVSLISRIDIHRELSGNEVGRI